MEKNKTVTAVVDRREGDKAVLLLGEDEKQVVFPIDYLPASIEDGDYLRISVAVDTAAKDRALQEMQELLNELRGDND